MSACDGVVDLARDNAKAAVMIMISMIIIVVVKSHIYNTKATIVHSSAVKLSNFIKGAASIDC